MLNKNTLNKGSVRYIIFKEKNDPLWYGVALELNIVVSSNNDTGAFLELKESIDGYIDGLREMRDIKKDQIDEILNQKPMDRYEQLWEYKHSSSESSLTVKPISFILLF